MTTSPDDPEPQLVTDGIRIPEPTTLPLIFRYWGKSGSQLSGRTEVASARVSLPRCGGLRKGASGSSAGLAGDIVSSFKHADGRNGSLGNPSSLASRFG